MRPKTPGLLWDMHRSASLILERCKGISADELEADIWLRAAVERHFGILGEAARRIADYDPAIATKIPHLRTAIKMRNFLAHSYDKVDYGLVKESIDGPVVELNRAVLQLLALAEPL